jgi:hypothetical protein
MKTNKQLVIILILTFILQGLSAQKIYRDGYIVKKTGESLTGLVQYSDRQGVPSQCTFKRFDIAREVSYSPSEIQAFGYRNGNRYESREVDNKTTFLEVIATGKIILYKKGSKYYIDKDHLGLVELKNGPVIYNTAEGNKEFKNLAAFLTYATEGKAGTVQEKFNIKEEIEPLIISYNKASGSSYNVFNRSISEKQLINETWKSGAARSRFGVVSGVNLYTLNMKFNPDMYGITNNDYVPDPENAIGPVFGLTYERLLSRRTDKFSARIDILYNSQDFYSYTERENTSSGITRDETRFSFTGIKVPLLFQYSLTGSRIVPYVNIGGAYQYFIKKTYLHTAEVEDYAHEINIYEDSNMLFKSGEFTLAGGLGVRTRVSGKMNLHLMYMFEAGKGLFLNTDPTDTNSRSNDPYIMNSIQSTILLGITF